MRAREFIIERNNTTILLREYRRDITLRSYGPALAQRFSQDSGTTVEGDPEYIGNNILGELERLLPQLQQYIPWVVREYVKKNIRQFEDIPSRIVPALEKYDQIKARIPQDAVGVSRDIMRMQARNLEDAVDWYYKEEKPKMVDRGDYREVYSDANVRVVQPLDQNAACYYGQGTRWCTAATQGENYFDQYSKDGPLYILLPKNPQHAGEKYQIQFESGQYMDETDSPMKSSWLLRERFPNLYNFFMKMRPQMIDDLPFAPDDTIVEVWRAVGKRVGEILDREFRHEAQYDEDYQEWVEYKAHNLGYIDQKTGDIDELKVAADKQLQYAAYDEESSSILNGWQKIMEYSADEIRSLGQMYTEEISGEPTSVTQIPTLWNAEMQLYPENEDRWSLDTKINVLINVFWKLSDSYKHIKQVRTLYVDDTVGDYVIGRLGAFKK